MPTVNSLIFLVALFGASAAEELDKTYTPENVGGYHIGHVPYERTPLTCACPDHFTLAGERCERVVEFPTVFTCPVDFREVDSKCIRQRAPEKECPFGFARVKSECIRREVTIPKLTCPGDYKLEISPSWGKKDQQLVCIDKVPVTPIHECPNGAPFHGTCFAPVAIPAEFDCPQGYIPGTSKTCTRYGRVECGSKHNHRMLRAEGFGVGWDADITNVANWGSSNLKRSLWNDIHHAQPKPVFEVDEECFATVTVPANPFCSEGELRNRQCITEKPVEPVLVCPAFGTTQKCFSVDRVAPKPVCPAGFTEECSVLKSNFDCDCVRIERAPIATSCPPGYTLHEGHCTTTTSLQRTCPPNSQIAQGMCLRDEFAAPICTYTVNFACTGDLCKSPREH